MMMTTKAVVVAYLARQTPLSGGGEVSISQLGGPDDIEDEGMMMVLLRILLVRGGRGFNPCW